MADGSLIFDTKTDTSGLDNIGKSLKNVIGGLGLAAVAKQVEELGSTFETSFAKASTLFGDVSVDTGNLNQKIKEMSNSSGTAASELNESLYQAMSAGIPVTEDMAECLGAVDVANKLSIGGYTDASTAMGALTTAINAYKMNASDAESVSDKLLVVQNKGVTTVDELASSMGKAIATGSNYGVNLDNLCAAYISLTKNGISTAEGTTYLNSLIKELGDSGSTAAGILQDKTGKSFGQLMNDGYSLGDVLQIISDSCDGDTEAFANLWSSAEGGMAASAIVSQGTDTFNDSLTSLADSAGTTESAYNTMSDTFEKRTERLKQSASNLAIELFQDVEPALELIVQGLQWCADNMTIVLGVLTPLIAGFIAWKVATGFSTALNALTIAMNGLNAAILANPIGALIALIVALVAGFIYLWNNCDSFREFWINLWGTIKEAASAALDAIVSFFTETIPNFIQSIIDWFAQLPDRLAEWGQNVYTTVTTAISNMVDSAITFISELPEKIAYWLGFAAGKVVEFGLNLIAWATTAIPEFINSVVTFISELPGKFADWLAKTIKEVEAWAVETVAKAKTAGQNFIDNVITFISELPGNIANWLAQTLAKIAAWKDNLVAKGTAAAKGLFDSIVNGITNLPDTIRDIGKNIVDGLWKGIKNSWSNLQDKVKKLADNLLKGFKDALGIHSPSRKFKWVGEMCIAGMDEPIADYNPYDTLNKSIKANVGTMKANFVGSGSYAENMNLGIDYDTLGNRVANALTGMAVNMDGKRVGTLVAPHVDYALANLAAVRT